MIKIKKMLKNKIFGHTKNSKEFFSVSSVSEFKRILRMLWNCRQFIDTENSRNFLVPKHEETRSFQCPKNVKHFSGIPKIKRGIF